MKHAKLFINGHWRDSNRTITHQDPCTEKPFGTISVADHSDVEDAVAVARVALAGWRARGVTERAAILGKFASLLAKHYGNAGEATPLKRLICEEVGKRLPEADIEVIESSDMMKYFAAEAERMLSPVDLALDQQLWATKRSQIRFEPMGVIGVIKPWNYPLEIPLWSIGPALLAGNTIVFKPSEHSTFTAIEMVRLFEEAGLPPGVLNLISGDGDTGRQLVNSAIDMVSFTGSIKTGREIGATAGKRLRKCLLELGGNDAAIVDADADLELAANGLTWGAFCNSGQVCVGVKRAFVHERVHDELVRLITQKASALRPGIDYGPLVSSDQLRSVDTFVQDAVAKGARVICGGARIHGMSGYYYPPTILVAIAESSSLLIDECFGPILPVMKVGDMEEAVARANNSEFGLGASVWSANRQSANRLADRLDAGMVWINDVNVALPQAPWGGRKNSGIGADLSEFVFHEYTIKKHVCDETSTDVRRVWWYPY